MRQASWSAALPASRPDNEASHQTHRQPPPPRVPPAHQPSPLRASQTAPARDRSNAAQVQTKSPPLAHPARATLPPSVPDEIDHSSFQTAQSGRAFLLKQSFVSPGNRRHIYG